MPHSQGEPLVVVIDVDLSPAARVRIQSLSASLTLLDGISEATISQADVIYTGRADFNPSQAPNLRWIQTNSAAVESLLSRPVAASGIPVANVRGAYTVAVAEMAVQMMLALYKLISVYQWVSVGIDEAPIVLMGKGLWRP